MRWWSGVSVVVGMIGVGCLGLAVVYSGCGLAMLPAAVAFDQAGVATGKAYDKVRKLPPESEWNAVGVWHRISDSPPTYLPKGYGRNRITNEKSGTWMIDERDGKRLFVPHEGGAGFSHSVLMMEAKKVTEWPERESQIDIIITPKSLIFGEP